MRISRQASKINLVVAATLVAVSLATAAAFLSPASDGSVVDASAAPPESSKGATKDRPDRPQRPGKGNGRGVGKGSAGGRSSGDTLVVDVGADGSGSSADEGTSTSGETTTTAANSNASTTSTTSSPGDGTPQPTTSPSGTVGGNTPSVTSQPIAPIRAAFFYPWFPNAWRQGGIDPFTNFSPSLGRYSSSDPETIRRQLDLADNAHIDAFIASWWGVGHHTDDAMSALLDTTTSSSSPHGSLKWAVYYEPEGYGDPSASRLAGDLSYLNTNYFDHPAYLRVDGKPVVFVWAESSDGADMAERWASANEQFGGNVHVVLKVFSGYRSVVHQPDSWHQYGPAVAYSDHLPHSATVSPGFWLAGQGVRLSRDLARFERDVVQMNNSGAFWQLITSWNEWGEGTSVEPASEFGTSYIDVLSENPPSKTGQGSSTPTPTSSPSPSTTATSSPTTPPASSSGSVRFTAGGDHGANSRTDKSLQRISALEPRFHLALGDLGYSETPTERAWCDYVKSHLGQTPVQLVVGNHEDDDRPDGYIGEFVKCLPDRMDSRGTYGAEYYFDVDGLVRVILIGAGNDVAGVDYDYDKGTSHHAWLSNTIDDARSRGIPWVVVGMHKVCITAGKKPCEVGPDVINLLIDKKVDLVVHGHEHNYQRSKQVRCIEVDRYRSDCVVDDGSDGRYQQGAGLVWAIAGNFGGSGLYEVNRGDPEYGYLAEAIGGGDPNAGRGFLQIDVNSEQLAVRFVGSDTNYSDSFSVHR